MLYCITFNEKCVQSNQAQTPAKLLALSVKWNEFVPSLQFNHGCVLLKPVCCVQYQRPEMALLVENPNETAQK